MNSVKNFLMVAGAFALAMILFAIAAPKTAHAIVATLVQITNTASNPVPVDADNSARHAVRLFTSGTTDQYGVIETRLLDAANGYQEFTVPAGKRLVIEQASIFAYPQPGSKVFAYWNNGLTYTAVPAQEQTPGAFEGVFTTRDYVDAGHKIVFDLFMSPSSFFDMSVVGYLIDCNGVC